MAMKKCYPLFGAIVACLLRRGSYRGPRLVEGGFSILGGSMDCFSGGFGVGSVLGEFKSGRCCGFYKKLESFEFLMDCFFF